MWTWPWQPWRAAPASWTCRWRDSTLRRPVSTCPKKNTGECAPAAAGLPWAGAPNAAPRSATTMQKKCCSSPRGRVPSGQEFGRLPEGSTLGPFACHGQTSRSPRDVSSPNMGNNMLHMAEPIFRGMERLRRLSNKFLNWSLPPLTTFSRSANPTPENSSSSKGLQNHR